MPVRATLVCCGVAVAIVVGLWSWTGTPSPSSAMHLLQPRDEAVYPPDFPAPTWRWEGGTAPYAVRLDIAGQIVEARTSDRWWRPSDATWRIANQPGGAPLTLTVRDAAGRRVSAAFSTSADPVTGSLLFREVVLPFSEAVKDPTRLAWRFGPVTAPAPPRVVLTGLPVCGNCHSFSRDGTVFGMDVDYANDKGSYALLATAPDMVLDRSRIISWSAYRPDDGRLTFGLLARVAPDGRHVIATVKDRSIFVPVNNLAYSQKFFPIQGILAVYDRERKSYTALAGADDPAYVQANAVWSPDGKWVYFCRAPAVELTGLRYPKSAMLTPEEADDFFRKHPDYGYGIWRVPWNDGRGGTAEPVPGAVLPGRSCYFPTFTPDGRFMVFCQARRHMLLQPDAELWILPLAGGPARRMRCNGPGMNSWHTISPDGRWMVFSAKHDGPYTRLMLTHLDAEGHDTPAVPLERLTLPERAANIPEFTTLAPEAIVRIREDFLSTKDHLQAGTHYMNEGDRAQAERHFRAGLAADPANAELRFCLGTVLAGQERLEEAILELREAVRLCTDVAPYREGLARALLANALLTGRSTDEAREEATRALALARANRDEVTSAAAQRLLALCHRQAPVRAQPQGQKENP